MTGAPPFKAFLSEKALRVEERLRARVKKTKRLPPWNDHIAEILRAVASERGLVYQDFVDAVGIIPTQAVGRARDEAILRCSERYCFSSVELGIRFGMGHTSILSALKRAKKAREK